MICPSSALNFLKLDFFLKHRRVPLRKNSVMWDRSFDKKSWYTPLLSYSKSSSIPEVFCSETQNGSPTKVFGTVRQKLWQKTVIHTLLHFSINVFETRNFLKHRKVPLRHFSLLETKTLTEKRDTPPSSLIHKKFRYPMFFETQTCSSTKHLDSVGQKILSRK